MPEPYAFSSLSTAIEDKWFLLSTGTDNIENSKSGIPVRHERAAKGGRFCPISGIFFIPVVREKGRDTLV
jgi:hypothetical protein